MVEIKAPNEIPWDGPRSIFLAGSIEMGTAFNWQTKVSNSLADQNIMILNPRRDDWDSSWTQSIENDQFRTQVEWELAALERARIIVMYFDPNTKSPISLLELGLYASSGKLVVCCPEGFWRKGNVDIVCKKFNIKQASSLEELITIVKERLNGVY